MNDAYAEFDDVVRDGPFARSAKAIAEMVKIKTKYGFAFVFNPGGGEFFCNGFRCQIHGQNDIEDLARLRNAIERLNV